MIIWTQFRNTFEYINKFSYPFSDLVWTYFVLKKNMALYEKKKKILFIALILHTQSQELNFLAIDIIVK